MLQSGLPEIVSDEEDLASFLVHRSQFSQKMVKPAAFMPSLRDRETSVYRQGSSHDLRHLGMVAAGSRTLYGAAIVQARVVRDVGLEVEASEPPLHHAAIRRWPWREDDPLESKAEQKTMAAAIASAAGKPLIF